MAWLAVDKDGEEVIYKDKPLRCEDCFNTKEWDDPYIILPKGSIEKLIGRELTWNNEPVELD